MSHTSRHIFNVNKTTIWHLSKVNENQSCVVVIIFEDSFKFFDEYKTVNFLNLCQTPPRFFAAAREALLPRGDSTGVIPSL